MPEPDIEVDASSVLVAWGTLWLAGPGTLRLTSTELVVNAGAGGSLRARYAELRGGGWRTGSLTLHGEPGHVAIQSADGLEHAWVHLLERVCPLPELARGHRLLGSRRGGSVDAQARFIAPLLQARRRLEDESDLEARVAAMDARALRKRIGSALEAIAKDAFPSSHPDRRGLEAELGEAMTALFAELDAMEAAAAHFRNAPESIRFVAWREWVSAVSSAFAVADTGWASAARLLPGPVRP
jgi:hypothetical protein